MTRQDTKNQSQPFKISWRQAIPTFVTILAMLAGFISILKAASGEYFDAAQLIMLSMILDGFDGNIARKLKGTSQFGAEFDTFVDIMSFGIAPALLAYQAVLHEFGVFGLMLSSAIVLSGMWRLSRFRLVDPHRGMKGFLGLPITVNAAWVALVVYMAELSETFSLFEGWTATLAWGCSSLMILLQVSHLHYGKPMKHWIFFIPGAAVVLGLFMHNHIGLACAAGMCIYGLFYAFVSPFLPKTEVLLEEDGEEEEAIRVRHG